MAGESLFQKIKRNVEEEKNKKVRGEARLTSLKEEQSRIFRAVEEEAGGVIITVEDVEQICDDLKGSIEKDIAEMVEVLRGEGIEL